MPNPTPAVPPQPTSVEEAREHLAKWPQSMNRKEFLVDVDAVIASVRAEERDKAASEYANGHQTGLEQGYAAGRSATLQEVKAMVEGIRDNLAHGTCDDVADETYSDVLDRLAWMETP